VVPSKKSPTRSDKIIAFIEKLRITIGVDAGKLFKLRPWQRKFIRDVYDNLDGDGSRRTRRAVLSVARKNGKSELAAALVLVHLIGPESELNGEIIAAANSREQASVVFNAVKRMVEADPWLLDIVTVVPSTKRIFVHRSGIACQGSIFKAVSAEAGNLHGLNPSMVIYDELAQAKNRELFDTLTTSQGARSEPLFLTISTQNNDPQHVLSEMIDDGLRASDKSVVCHLYAADDDCDLLDEEAWKAANPALGDFLSMDNFTNMARRAARLPSDEHAFRLLHLNQRVSAHASLIAQTDWRACQAAPFEFADGEPIYLGLDLSATTDLTALVAVSALNGARVKAWFWKPDDLVKDHAARDRVPYDIYQNQGLLEPSPGRIVRTDFVAKKLIDLCGKYDVRGLAYDRYKIEYLLKELGDVGFESQQGEGYGLRLEPWGQGFKDMTPAIQALEEAVLSGDLKHDGHPLLTFCVTNAQAESDAAGCRKLSKKASRFRIDGAVALAMACGLKARDSYVATPISPFEDPEFRILC
jgi:phage terminase large subunit-like protein